MTIGILPCAGNATRLHGLPKYLLPVGDSYLLAIHVRRMQAAGVKHVYIGANRDNYDLVEKYAPDRCTVYLVNSKTMSETILAARKYAGDEDVLFSMPDTYFDDETIYNRMCSWVQNSPCVAAVFETRPEQRRLLGMCEIGEASITRIMDKPQLATGLVHAWGMVAWKPSFWPYIQADDPNFGTAMQRAIDYKIIVTAIGSLADYFDCGTSAEYFKCIREITGVTHATN
jgi:UTP-glucose-1-phosphate uridylyltransferase